MEPKKFTHSLAEFSKPTGEGLAWRLGAVAQNEPGAIGTLRGLK
jgi:hypothetical protein